MWDDFKIGTITVATTYLSGATDPYGSKTEFGIRFKGDVGDYMDADGGNELVLEGGLITGIDSSDHMRIVESSENGDGALYVSRIQDRIANQPDYEGYYNTTHGDAQFLFQQIYQQGDKLRASAV